MQLNYLRLYLGVPSPLTYGASGQYDPVPESIDFLDTSAVFQLDSNGGVPAYEYAIAGLKNGGVRGDSPIVDSSVILAAPYGTVTESITLVSAAAASSQNATLSKIERFGRYANGLNANTYQSMPVYIERWCDGEPAPTYALVLDMSFSVIGDNELGGIARLTVSWEREPFWRAIPPGANPKLYAFQQRELAPGTDFDYTDLTLTDFGGAANLQNWREETIGNAGTFTATTNIVENFIDIDAEDIPGDAPALLCAVIDAASLVVGSPDVYMARNTKPGVTAATPENARMSHNGGDASIASSGGVTMSYAVAATGIRCDPPGASAEGNYELQVVYAAGAITASNIAAWQRVMLKNHGRYAVLVRSRVTAGVNTDMQLQLRLSGFSSVTPVQFDETLAFTPNSGSTHTLYYVGNFDLGNIGEQMNVDGTGSDAALDYLLQLRSVTRGAAAAVTLRIADVILMPYDEFTLMGRTVPFPLADYGAIFDGTGYFTRARAVYGGLQYSGSLPFTYALPVQTTGQIVPLEPNTDNRLYFLFGNDVAHLGMTSETIQVRLNIVPRWRHLRDRL